MAPEKQASEGIALLSVYGDEDDEMEDLDEEEQKPPEEDIPPSTIDVVAVKDNDGFSSDYGNESMIGQLETRGSSDGSNSNKTLNHGTSSASATSQILLFSPQQQTVSSDLIYAQSKKSRLTIVDYGHEEGAMSPEAEEGEMMATGKVMYGQLLQTSDGEFRDMESPAMLRVSTPSTQAVAPQTSDPIDQPESDAMYSAVNELESMEIEDAIMASVEEQKDTDPLHKFLPPSPNATCSEELQEKFFKFIALKRTTGRSFNSEVRNRKEYRNPDFLLHAVTYQDIDQIGSCFSKDVFAPHGYDKSDFYDEIEADMRKEMERREQERKKSQKLDFTSGGLQNIVPLPKVSTPASGLTSGGMLNVTLATSDVTARDGRQNKKSKWDKVDVDQRSYRATGGHENLPSVGANAALLSAAKSGSGYSAFAQQRRKEAEDRRST